jgi:hypothetical protein
VKDYLKTIVTYYAAIAALVIPATVGLYGAQFFALPAFGRTPLGILAVLALAASVVGWITLVRIALTIRTP